MNIPHHMLNNHGSYFSSIKTGKGGGRGRWEGRGKGGGGEELVLLTIMECLPCVRHLIHYCMWSPQPFYEIVYYSTYFKRRKLSFGKAEYNGKFYLSTWLGHSA